VSPRSGRAVSAVAGAPWRDRLLPLPGFLIGRGTASLDDIIAGLALTGHFLAGHGLRHDRAPLPAARERLVMGFRRLVV